MTLAEWYKQVGVTKTEAKRLEKVLCLLVDYQELLMEHGAKEVDTVIDALRTVVDGDDNVPLG